MTEQYIKNLLPYRVTSWNRYDVLGNCKFQIILPVGPRWYEVQAAVDSVVLHMPSVESTFVGEVLAELFVDVSGADSPRVLTVNCITKTWRVHYSQTQFYTALLNFHSFLLNRCCLFYSICNRHISCYLIFAHFKTLKKCSKELPNSFQLRSSELPGILGPIVSMVNSRTSRYN